jgi:hypothetical protein
MKCDCYDEAYRPLIALLEEADGIMYYMTPDYDKNSQRLHDIILSLNTKFKCIDECWKKITLETNEK